MASAVLGAIALELVSVYEGMQRQSARTDLHTEAQNLMQTVADSLSQPGNCNNAFKATGAVGGPNVRWNAWAAGIQAVTVDHIEVGGTALVSQGQTYPKVLANGEQPLFTLSSMKLRRPVAPEFIRPDGFVNVKIPPGAAHRDVSVTARLDFTFQYRESGLQSASRSLEMIVAIDNKSGTNSVDSCISANVDLTTSFACNAANVYPGMECPAVMPDPDPTHCSNLYALVGFDGFGKPECSCQITCQGYYQGPTGTATCNDRNRTGCGYSNQHVACRTGDASCLTPPPCSVYSTPNSSITPPCTPVDLFTGASIGWAGVAPPPGGIFIPVGANPKALPPPPKTPVPPKGGPFGGGGGGSGGGSGAGGSGPVGSGGSGSGPYFGGDGGDGGN